ncbi:MAG: hypothetical protein QOG53_115 [Frankiales bacterium]|jgi:uncharacterized protein (TIGR03083 family)|nr:hypothetical protein [Frankiales bacterium]
MEIAEHLLNLRGDGELLADVAERVGLDARVPTCPEWAVRDLVRHQGDVHRWAAGNLTRNTSVEMSAEESEAVLFTWPDADDGLIAWFRDGHALLVETLESVPDDVVAFTFIAAPSPRAFWARRQAHETAIHRADAESVAGPITPYDAQFAADGIDELMYGMASRPGRITADPPRTLRVDGADSSRIWQLTIGPDGLTVSDEGGEADCWVSGPTSDLYLLLWNRRTTEGLQVAGDPSLLDHWRDVLKVRWSGATKKSG